MRTCPRCTFSATAAPINTYCRHQGLDTQYHTSATPTPGTHSLTLLPTTIRKNMSSDHTIWCDHTFSKKWTFVHTENYLFAPSKFVHTVKILFTQSKFCSHSQNFVHTLNIYFTPVKFLFTPSKFGSHHHNFIHTPKLSCSHPPNFCSGWRVGVLRTGPVAAGVRVYSSVSHL
jgi:hypothetical protein